MTPPGNKINTYPPIIWDGKFPSAGVLWNPPSKLGSSTFYPQWTQEFPKKIPLDLGKSALWVPPLWAGPSLFSPNDPQKGITLNPDPAQMTKLLGAPSAFPEDPMEKWVNFLSQLFNNVLSLDLDIQNLPVNRGTGLPRFSEFESKKGPLTPPHIEVFPNTTARAHGEIRPIKGKNESWITRVVVDFDKNVFYRKKGLPALEIDGFTAVDPPRMSFDFTKERDAVLSLKGGDYSYENPEFTGGPLITPFASVTEAPPGGHDYWMFRFNPIANSGLAYLMEKTSDGALDPVLTQGRGALLLWSFLPTFGITGEKAFKELGIPQNTLPRRFGDLIKLISPMFDGEVAENYRQAGPYYNPNTEYMAPYLDENGKLLPFPKKWRDIVELNERRKQDCAIAKHGGQAKCLPLLGRQPLPEDPKEALQLDKLLIQLGLPRVPRKRGAVLDWIFTDLAKDPARLKAMKAAPYATLHLKMRPTVLDTPVGKLQVDSTTDIQAYYTIRPVQNPKTKTWEARISLRVDIVPMKLMDVDLDAGPFHLKTKLLKAKKVVFQIPSIPGMSTEDPAGRPPWTIALEGVDASGLSLTDGKKSFDVGMGSATIEKLNFTFQENWLEATLGDLKSNPGKFNLEKCAFPTADGKEKYACFVPDEQGVWKGYSPQDYPGPKALPDSTPVVVGQGGNWKFNILKASGKGLVLDSSFGKLNASEFDIPETRLATTLEPREKTDPSGKSFRADEVRFVSVSIPEIRSKIGLDFKVKDSGTTVKLEGSSSLKDLSYFSENQGAHTHTQVKVDLSGVIQTAELQNPAFGSAKFTTQEDPVHLHQITGKLRSTSVKSNQDPQAKPKIEVDLDLDLPYVGFETDGVFKIPKGSSTLRGAHLNLSAKPGLALKLTGHMDLNRASLESTEPFDVGRFQLLPHLANFSAKGDFEFAMSPDGFRLKPTAGSTEALQLDFDLAGSKFHHTPNLENHPIGKLPESKVIETDLAIKSGKVRLAGLRQVEVKRLEVEGKKRNKLTQLDAGPVTLYNLEGSGTIWVDLVIWGFVRGLFPMIGGPKGKETPKRPDPAPLTEHLPAEEKTAFRKFVGEGDFLHFGKVQLETQADAKWKFNLSDFLMNLHEVDGRQQFGLIRVPEIHLHGGGQPPTPLKVDLGKGGFLVNIFLNDPERGGFFRIRRWK